MTGERKQFQKVFSAPRCDGGPVWDFWRSPQPLPRPLPGSGILSCRGPYLEEWGASGREVLLWECCPAAQAGETNRLVYLRLSASFCRSCEVLEAGMAWIETRLVVLFGKQDPCSWMVKPGQFLLRWEHRNTWQQGVRWVKSEFMACCRKGPDGRLGLRLGRERLPPLGPGGDTEAFKPL